MPITKRGFLRKEVKALGDQSIIVALQMLKTGKHSFDPVWIEEMLKEAKARGISE
jgi:hypothetical protein